jgi:hypothetical protein
VFLKPGEQAPSKENEEPDLSQEELLKQMVYIEHRPMKDPRDLKVLAPACGSGHFLLYAFDMLERIYEEAWADAACPASEATGKPMRDEYDSLEKFKRDIPRLIIEHNLYGIDIDPRCVQIAGLSLWLRAQKAWQRLGLKAVDRPAIKRSGIVCAAGTLGRRIRDGQKEVRIVEYGERYEL